MDKTATAPAVPSLASILAQVADPRARRGQRHPWAALLLLVAAALLSGANTQRAVARWGQHYGWARMRRLGFTRRQAPSQPTVQRLLAQVDVRAVEALLGQWLGAVRAALLPGVAHWVDGIALDGKTLRGARRLGAADAHLLSACCQWQGVVLGQVAVPDRTNEQGAVDALLDHLLLDGETVTFDAQFTQQVIARSVVARGGAYLMVAKGNQPTLRADIATATRRPSRLLGQARTLQAAHGRIEERTLLAAAARPSEVAWPHAQQVLRLRRRVVCKRTAQVHSDETAYAVTSLTPAQATPADLLRLWQTHWTVENPVHWVRDVVFGEDRATTRTGRAHQALAAFRNLALSLLRLWRGPEISAAREFFAARPATLLRYLFRSPVPTRL
jgi:predicted transposase YbfD/YdcC